MKCILCTLAVVLSLAPLGAKTMEESGAADHTVALPEPAIGRVRFDVLEVSPGSGASQTVCRVDSADAATYAPDRGKAAYAVRNGGGETYLRLGENKRWGYGFGVKPAKPVAVSFGSTLDIGFTGRVASNDCTFVLYVKALDASGADVTPGLATPHGWTYSPYSKAWWIAPISLPSTNRWLKSSFRFVIPDGAAFVVPIVTAFRGSGVDFRGMEVVAIDAKRNRRLAFNRRVESGDGKVSLLDETAQIRLDATSVRDDAGAVLVKATVTDVASPKRPRALQVSLCWDRDLKGWQWHRHWREDVPIEGTGTYRYEYSQTGMPVGRYPFSAVSKDGTGVLLGTEFDGPVFESRAVSSRGIVSTVRLGLLERNGKGFSAELGWLAMPFRGDWGFRSAARAYYASQARKLPVPPPEAKEGAWSWPVRPTALPENPDDFGLTFWEAPEDAAKSPKERELAHSLGIGVYPYSEVGGMRQVLKGSEKSDLPPVEERLAELKRWTTEKDSKAVWFSAPRNEAAQACLNSLPVSPDGTHPFVLDKWDSWTHWWMTNPDPRLAKPNRFSLCWDHTVGRYLDSVDGVYLDSLGTAMSGFNNVRPEHLAVMTEPLVYDEATARPCANGMHHLTAYVKWVADKLHPMGKRLFGNAFNVSYRFHATTVDIMGREVGSFGHANVRDLRLRTVLPDEEACLQRFYCHRRPVVNLLQEGNFESPLPAIPAEGITNYVNHHVFYAFYPGICTIGGEDKPGYAGWRRYFDAKRQCERDRALFKRAIPVIRRLNRAGWEPETLIRSDRKTVLVERYGKLSGESLVTLRNASDEAATVTLKPDAPLKGRELKPVWRGAANIALGDAGWRFSLAPWETVVCEVREAPKAVSDVEVHREGCHGNGLPTCRFITYSDWSVEIDNGDSCGRGMDGMYAPAGEKRRIPPPVDFAKAIRKEAVPITAAGVASNGFACTLEVDFTGVNGAEALVEVPGALLLCFRPVDVANRKGLGEFDRVLQNYVNYPGFVIEAMVPGPAGRIGIPLGIMKEAKGVKTVRLNHTGAHWQIAVDDMLDENLPFTAICWPKEGAVARICSPRVKGLHFASPAERDIGLTRFGAAKAKPVTKALQYYTPPDHNAWVGDVVTGFHQGRFHIFYLFDRRHHRSKAGRGAHFFAHLSSTDLKNWEEHPSPAAIEAPWEAHGTGTPFAWNGKYCMAYGLHTVRTVAWKDTTGPVMSAYRQKHGEEGTFTMTSLAPLIPQGGTYAVSDDGGLTFRKSGILFTQAQNPTVYNRDDGTFALADYVKLMWSDHFGDWKVWDDKIPTHGDCPSVFSWNGHHYIIQGFFTMAHSPDGRPGSFVSLEERGEDIYDGLAVPMVSPFHNNRRIMAGWINHVHGWGGWLCFRELVQDADGRLGTKWLDETPPPVSPEIWRGLSPEETFAVRFRSNEGKRFEFRIEPKAGRAQFADVGNDGAAPRQKTLQEIVCQLPPKSRTVGEVFRFGPPNQGDSFAIGKIRGLDKPYGVRLVAWYDAKSGVTVFDAEIAGRRTMVCRRPGRWTREK